MIKIPRIEGQEQITRQPLAVRPTEGIFSTAVSKASQELAKTSSAIAAQFLEVQVLKETTDAVTFSKRRINEIQLEAEQTENVFDSGIFKEKIGKVREEALKGISLPQAQQDFGRVFDRDAVVAEFNIQSTLRTRQVDAVKTSMLENIEVLKDNSLNRGKELTALLASNVRNRIITGEQAFKLKKATLKSWQESDIRNAIATDAVVAMKQIIEGTFGKLSASETSDWLSAADQQAERNIEIADKVHDEKWLSNGGDVVANLEKVSVEDIIQMIAQDDVDPNLGNDLIKWKTDPYSVQYETDKKIWMELVRDSVTPENDLRKFQNAIAKAIADKKIQATDAANLSVQVKSLFEKAINFKSKDNGFMGKVRNGLNSLSKWVADAILPETDITFKLYNSFLNKIRERNTPEGGVDDITDEIIRDARKELDPSILTIPESGEDRTDQFGNRAIVFPDGSFKEIPSEVATKKAELKEKK